MPTPFDDLRCIDCDRLWSEHNCIPGDPGLHFVMDNETAEDLRRYLIALAEKVESLRAENRALWAELVGLRTYLKRSIAADIGGDTEAWEIIDGLSDEDTTMIDRWLEAMQSKKENP